MMKTYSQNYTVRSPSKIKDSSDQTKRDLNPNLRSIPFQAPHDLTPFPTAVEPAVATAVSTAVETAVETAV